MIRVAAPDQAFGSYERAAAQIDLRLIPKLEPAPVERFLEADFYRGRQRERRLPRRLELSPGHRAANGFASKRLLEPVAHLQAMPGADPAYVVEQPGAAAAHQLDDAAVALFSQQAQHLDGVGAFEGQVEEDHVGMAALEGGDGFLNIVVGLGLEAEAFDRHGDEPADAFLVIDDEHVGGGWIFVRCRRGLIAGSRSGR